MAIKGEIYIPPEINRITWNTFLEEYWAETEEFMHPALLEASKWI